MGSIDPESSRDCGQVVDDKRKKGLRKEKQGRIGQMGAPKKEGC
jgi:hypothetical protein